MFVGYGTPRSPSSLPLKSPPNRHAVVRREPTLTKLQRPPVSVQAACTSSPLRTHQARRLPSSTVNPSDETPIPVRAVPCSWTPEPRDHRAACSRVAERRTPTAIPPGVPPHGTQSQVFPFGIRGFRDFNMPGSSCSDDFVPDGRFSTVEHAPIPVRLSWRACLGYDGF
jgi:hypothetical protein